MDIPVRTLGHSRANMARPINLLRGERAARRSITSRESAAKPRKADARTDSASRAEMEALIVVPMLKSTWPMRAQPRPVLRAPARRLARPCCRTPRPAVMGGGEARRLIRHRRPRLHAGMCVVAPEIPCAARHPRGDARRHPLRCAGAWGQAGALTRGGRAGRDQGPRSDLPCRNGGGGPLQSDITVNRVSGRGSTVSRDPPSWKGGTLRDR